MLYAFWGDILLLPTFETLNGGTRYQVPRPKWYPGTRYHRTGYQVPRPKWYPGTRYHDLEGTRYQNEIFRGYQVPSREKVVGTRYHGTPPFRVS